MEKSTPVNMYTVDKNVRTVTVLGYVYSTACNPTGTACTAKVTC